MNIPFDLDDELYCSEMKYTCTVLQVSKVNGSCSMVVVGAVCCRMMMRRMRGSVSL